MGCGEGAALYRLHYRDFDAAAAAGLIAKTGLDGIAVPVHIVDLELDDLDFRVRVEYSVERLGGGMVAEADMPGQPALLKGFQIIPAAGPVQQLQAADAYAVQVVKVEILKAGALELGPEYAFIVFRTLEVP